MDSGNDAVVGAESNDPVQGFGERSLVVRCRRQSVADAEVGRSHIHGVDSGDLQDVAEGGDRLGGLDHGDDGDGGIRRGRGVLIVL